MNKSIYELKLHEVSIVKDDSLFTKAIRVPGGWIYISFDKPNNIGTSVFIPFNNEFMEERK